MFVVANSFTFNGGSTFIVRLAREYARRGKRVGVLVLANKVEPGLKKELDAVADTFFLKDFIRAPFGWMGSSQLGVFSSINFGELRAVIESYGRHVHVMGVFGLVFVGRLSRERNDKFFVSAGVYHQYEYMFDASNLFSKYAQMLFETLGSQGVIFFNESTKAAYSTFFDIDYSDSLMVPIGIELPEELGVIGSSESRRIVSVGNLYPFKTYNLHIIKLMPELLKISDKFTYEIYGEGDLELEARYLIENMGLEDKVFLRGRVPYTRFADVLNGTFLFVGSGTAIVEASALGVPSIIGIESTQKPFSFGYLSDVAGFSYNEINESQATVPIYDLIRNIASDKMSWEAASIDCKNKASEFSIAYTVDGFERLEARQGYEKYDDLGRFSVLKWRFSFLVLILKEAFNLDNSFSSRRNGAIGKG